MERVLVIHSPHLQSLPDLRFEPTTFGWTCNPKVLGSNLRSGRDCRWGEWITSTLSTFNTMTEVRPLSKAPNPQLLPGRRSIGCPLLQVYVHYCVCALGWVKCRAQIPSMGHHTWPHTTSLSIFQNSYAFIKVMYISVHIILGLISKQTNKNNLCNM